MKTTKSFGIALLLLLVSTTVSAQCTFRNTAFKSGEFLTYNLYYNWKFVWVKAGNASMSIVQTTRHGKPAYRGSLVTRGNKRVDDIFVLATLCSATAAPIWRLCISVRELTRQAVYGR